MISQSIFRAIVVLAAFASTAVCSSCRKPTKTLEPIRVPVVEDSISVQPSRAVTLDWGSGGNGKVNVTLHTKDQAIVLERIHSVANVTCTSDTDDSHVSVAFDSSAGFALAVDAWKNDMKDGSMVLVTNHMGNCDEQNTRGFFSATNMTSDRQAMTITASAVKKNVQHVITEAEITFANMPVMNNELEERTIDWGESFEISTNMTIPTDSAVISKDNLTLIFDPSTSFSADFVFSGYLRFEILTFSFKELYFDFNATLAAELGIDLGLVYSANYSDLSWSPASLTYAAYSIPGILELGPALNFKMGLEFDIDAALNVSAGVDWCIDNGNLHLDLVHLNRSSATGWSPDHYNAHVNVTEHVSLTVSPFAAFTVEMACSVFSGLVDLSAGITAKPKFIEQFDIAVTQNYSVSKTTEETVARTTRKDVRKALDGPRENTDGAKENKTEFSLSTECDGIQWSSTFDFSIIAFATQWWHKTIYEYQKPLDERCIALW